MRQTIAVDMDEVIADALSEHLLRYNRDFACNLTAADLRGKWLTEFVPPDRQHIILQYMLSEDFFRSLAVMPHAQRVLARLQSRYDIFIATAAMEVPTSFNAKFHWLAEHFPFIPASRIVFCGDKSILRTDFLIDDNPRQLRLFEGRAREDAARHGDTVTAVSYARHATLERPASPDAPSSRPKARSAEVERPAVSVASEAQEVEVGSRNSTAAVPQVLTPQNGREGILFSSPANHYVTGFRRVDNWLDVEKLFLG